MTGETHRIWFGSERMGLIVWHDPGGPLMGFQLCFRAGQGKETVLAWSLRKGYSLGQLDSSEDGGMRFKMAATLLPYGSLVKDEALRFFRDGSPLWSRMFQR